MKNYMVSLERFYGPLDLLLYLVEKNEMDIYDISISEITDQYMAYLKEADEEEVEVEKMTAFLQMATFLMQLKSRNLLPKAPVFPELDTEEDPQAELIGRIILYKQFKQVAGFLERSQQDIIQRAFYRPWPMLPQVTPVPFTGEKESLYQAMQKLQQRKTLYQSLTLPLKDIRIEDKMRDIWEKLRHTTRPLRFSEAADTTDRREMTAAFLALLELMHQQKVAVIQTGLFREILIRRVKNA